VKRIIVLADEITVAGGKFKKGASPEVEDASAEYLIANGYAAEYTEDVGRKRIVKKVGKKDKKAGK